MPIDVNIDVEIPPMTLFLKGTVLSFNQKRNLTATHSKTAVKDGFATQEDVCLIRLPSNREMKTNDIIPKRYACTRSCC